MVKRAWGLHAVAAAARKNNGGEPALAAYGQAYS
jgi:hypothetical protein